jgi:hypothetical protein
MAVAPSIWCADEVVAADKIRLQLADAFTKKDMATIKALVTDPWSGLRFFSEKNDGMRESAGVAFREAKVVTIDENRVAYEIIWPSHTESKNTRKIIFILTSPEWKLDLNSFLGPFPHFR